MAEAKCLRWRGEACKPTRIRKGVAGPVLSGPKEAPSSRFKLLFEPDPVYVPSVANERADDIAGATLYDFARGQKIFGRYTLVKILGRGGMGIVWLARDEELEREVALKFLPDLIIRDAAVLSDLKRETRRCLELTHKNIVRIYDFVHDERSASISMEYIDGETLSNLRAEKKKKFLNPVSWAGGPSNSVTRSITRTITQRSFTGI